MPAHGTRTRRREYGVEDDLGNILSPQRLVGKQVMRDIAQGLADARGSSVYLFEVGEDRTDGTSVVVDREEVGPRAYARTSSPRAPGSGYGARRPSRGEIEQEVGAVRDGARRGSSLVESDAADAALIRALYEAYLVDGVVAARDASLATELLDASVGWLSPERYDPGVGIFSLARLRGPSARSSGLWLVQLRRGRPTPVYSLSQLEHRRRGGVG